MERHLSEFLSPEIIKKAGLIIKELNSDPLITGMEYDSRKVKPGNLFFAMSGLHTDGSLFIEDAVSKGALAVVCETSVAGKHPSAVFLPARDPRYAMSPIAASFYDHPSRRMYVTGVTGTEGKSTTTFLIWQLLGFLGKKAGFVSTVQHSLGGEALWNSEHQTTPEATAVQRLLWEMVENGCEYAVVESSSHGLSLRTNRLGDVEFHSAIMTNVTHEHLEFHGTWEQYRHDKANLFRALDRYAPSEAASSKAPFGVVSADDKSCLYFAEATMQKVFTFSVSGAKADLALETINSGIRGNQYRVFVKAENEHIEIRDNLPGAYNAGNVLAAFLVASGLTGLPIRKIAPFSNRLKPVRGRMTAINKGQPYEVVADYAHTPSSFKTIFPPLRERLNKTGGRIISVFGSAGERDTQKRPEQGKIAADFSDFIIITDEDPRGEKPMDILEEIACGVETSSVFKRGENLFLIPDRPFAIRKALNLARGGDLVLLLGKGHENSIIYADYVMPFDEISETEKALGEMGFTSG
ncbi:MAG: UDP-N-acetylmuramoyl-L-alanyl-D-glutamate--2,6-diaminopimelate ligase [Treponema sp.]|jgi:UDP-N-acetylmuramoyl-L-alanyl-D-glutamate--2,6-diaminopimelate ligase|nr:UDP-N-acetylmuramoyl-L-alanyl-D-glutamate--2,6-diaminopimelate ligase [Treponema sp.]